jgi:hypothetical protein
MMGHRQVKQAALFYEFSLEGQGPTDYLLRSIDKFVELGESGGSWPLSTVRWAGPRSIPS